MSVTQRNGRLRRDGPWHVLTECLPRSCDPVFARDGNDRVHSQRRGLSTLPTRGLWCSQASGHLLPISRPRRLRCVREGTPHPHDCSCRGARGRRQPRGSSLVGAASWELRFCRGVSPGPLGPEPTRQPAVGSWLPARPTDTEGTLVPSWHRSPAGPVPDENTLGEGVQRAPSLAGPKGLCSALTTCDPENMVWAPGERGTRM